MASTLDTGPSGSPSLDTSALVTVRDEAERVGPVAMLVIAAAAAVCAISFALHASTYYFLYDDYALVGEAIQRSVVGIVSEPLIGFYRPAVFLSLRAEWLLFGWQHPVGYLTVTLLAHLAATLLVRRTFARLESPFHGAATAVLFGASAWSSEATMWLSGRFDVLATCGVLVTAAGVVECASARSARARRSWVAVTVAGTALAVFSKESGAVAPLTAGAFLVWRLLRHQDRAIRTAVFALGASLAVVGIALSLRFGALGGGPGAYGAFTDLVGAASIPRNVWSYVQSAVLVPLPLVAPAGLPRTFSQDAHVAAAVICAMTAVAALVLRPRQALLALGVFLVCVAPVSWFGRWPESTVAGRFSYMPGIGGAAFIALGLDALASHRWTAFRDFSRPVGIALLGILTAYTAGSVVFQARLRRRATVIARTATSQAAPVLTRKSPGVHIPNLPSVCEEGPVILKAYAFGFMFQKAAPLRAEGTVVNCATAEVRRLAPFATQGADYATAVPGEVELELDFASLKE